jgi:hypothetical protein
MTLNQVHLSIFGKSHDSGRISASSAIGIDDGTPYRAVDTFSGKCADILSSEIG